MTKISLTKADITWGYLSHFFLIASGLLTLPIVLKLLSPEEIGLNYLMITIGSIIALIDFGFSPQISRFISYVFSGVQVLKKEGVEITDSGKINYRLLKTVIITAKSLYRRIAFFVLLLMSTFGSLYIYKVTNGFSSVNNCLQVWVLFCLSSFFNIFYSYFNPLLDGRGLITKSKKAIVFSKIVGVILTLTLLFLGLRLLAVVISNLVAPLVARFMASRYFFDDELNDKIASISVNKEERADTFKVIWYNARKLGLISVASSSLSYLTTFIIGLFLSLSSVASYGLMIQLIGIICSISSALFFTSYPRMSYLFVNNDLLQLKKTLSDSIVVFYVLFLLGTLCLMTLPVILKMLGSQTQLPSFHILLLCVIFTFFDRNQSIFSNLLLLKNSVPFTKASILTGSLNVVFVWLSLKLNWGLLGVVISQGLPCLFYSAWKWPRLAMKEFNIRWIDIYSNNFIRTLIIQKINRGLF